MKRFGILICTALLAGCQLSQEAGNAPPASQITTPGPDVPAAVAAFSGTWTGRWGANFDGRLIVRTVARDGSMTGTFSWGDLPGKVKAGSAEVTGRIRDATLTLDQLPNGATAAFVMQKDNTLAGAYVLAGETSTGAFQRSVVSAPAT